jgi:hypothetical protein
LAVALGLAAVWTAAGGARADDAWRAWSAGPLSFEAPAAMGLSTDFDQKLTPLDLAHPDWLLKLVAAQDDARALTARFSWAPDALGAESGASEISRAAITFAGRPALRREWRDDDVATRGFDILAADWGPKGAVFEFTCYADAKGWAKLQPNCERIAQSVRVAGLVATNSPPSPPTPTAVVAQAPPPTPVLRLEGQNTDAVVGGPKAETSFTVKAPIFLRKLSTYHWNDGRGATPGTMSLTGGDGATFGPWRARGEPGQGGAPNVNWIVEVNRRLEPGRYVVRTSSDETWSTNAKQGWKGFYSIEYQLYPEVAQSPPPPPTPPPPTPAANTVWTPPPAHESLFSGALDARWEKLQAFGGAFAAFAKLEPGALVVDAPAGHSWGHTGLASASFAGAFLDDFGAGARQTFTFRFDPARSTGFVAALVNDRDWCARGGNSAGVVFVFAPKAEGGGATARLVDLGDGAKDRVKVDLAATGAKEVAIALTPGKAAVSLDGVKLGEGDAKGVAAHLALSLCVFSQGRDVNLPGAFALKEIVVDRQPGAPEIEPKPATGVAPPPSVVLFGAKSTIEWEGQAPYYGGDFAKFGAMRGDRLDIDLPKGDGARTTGIVSKTQVVSFDLYADEAPYRLRYAFDPLRTTDFVVQLTDPRTWDWHYVHMVAGVNRRDGKTSEFFVRYCPGAEIRRAMPAQWNGDFELVLHNGWATVGIPGAFAVRCDEPSFGYQHAFFDIIATSPEKDGLPAAVTLLGATLARIPPDGMTAEQRWRYVADKDFDPAAFAKDLAADVGGAEINLP